MCSLKVAESTGKKVGGCQVKFLQGHLRIPALCCPGRSQRGGPDFDKSLLYLYLIPCVRGVFTESHTSHIRSPTPTLSYLRNQASYQVFRKLHLGARIAQQSWPSEFPHFTKLRKVRSLHSSSSFLLARLEDLAGKEVVIKTPNQKK